MAAPARAASMAAVAISSAVTGKWGDMLGVWMAPVGAQVMMALARLAMVVPCRCWWSAPWMSPGGWNSPRRAS
ncbi:protein of unknown function [Cupriavidus taiwanensis]|nr:protein of unknown function [Cupriavidus taiwanensis]